MRASACWGVTNLGRPSRRVTIVWLGCWQRLRAQAEEIGQARQGAKGLINTVQKMMALRRRVDEKNKLLKNVRANSGPLARSRARAAPSLRRLGHSPNRDWPESGAYFPLFQTIDGPCMNPSSTNWTRFRRTIHTTCILSQPRWRISASSDES